MLLVDTGLDREVTGRITRELTFAAFKVAVHYVELNQAHIQSPISITPTISILRLNAAHKRPPPIDAYDVHNEIQEAD